MPLSYPNYLKLDQLLSLQEPLSEGPEHDELLFIIIHQVYELWFKQILNELELVQRSLETNDEPNLFHGLKRILSILKTMVAQIDILETMTPVSFNAFRDRLETASGLQSVQFRQVEFVLGKRSEKVIRRYPKGSPSHEKLSSLILKPTLWDSFLTFLSLRGYHVPGDLIKRDLSAPPPRSAALQEVLIQLYRERSTLMQVCERLVDLDEGLQEWRYRHVKMVERTIGKKQGTGGSLGVDYLKDTIFKPLFPDLWEIRASL